MLTINREIALYRFGWCRTVGMPPQGTPLHAGHRKHALEPYHQQDNYGFVVASLLGRRVGAMPP